MIGSVALFVTVTTPPQLSVAVGAISEFTVHSAVMFAKVASVGTGAVTSSITIFCVCVDVFPFPSLYVQVTTVVPCVVIGSVALFVTVTTPPQLSVAVGAVKLATEHSAVTFAKVASVGTGAVTSSITTFCVCVDVFPFPSLYVQVTTVVP